MSEAIDLARGWLAKGDSDLFSARLIATSSGPYDTACFHAQQAAEKYLKGLLAFAGQPVPLTHNLEELERYCATLNPAPDFTGLDLTQLTPYAVQLRYDPGFWPDQATAVEALALAERVRTAVLAVLPQAAHPQRTNAFM
ncbi:MAG: HEPN domain-containing protein [Oscillochloridaceae bacterium]|nr:HEPN domain-containing protein [Chloroflexaceae bacterium]MDW8390444.1 HEPN domain-containing protein [Oscillochloridaceae bacterium]